MQLMITCTTANRLNGTIRGNAYLCNCKARPVNRNRGQILAHLCKAHGLRDVDAENTLQLAMLQGKAKVQKIHGASTQKARRKTQMQINEERRRVRELARSIFAESRDVAGSLDTPCK